MQLAPYRVLTPNAGLSARVAGDTSPPTTPPTTRRLRSVVRCSAMWAVSNCHWLRVMKG